jgi:hypothetical protein
MEESKFNSYGRLKTDKESKIKAGDTVQYSYADTDPNDRNKKKIIALRGTWDGEKVCFSDKKQTIVRTTFWLTLIEE